MLSTRSLDLIAFCRRQTFCSNNMETTSHQAIRNRTLSTGSCPSVTAMSNKIVDDNIEFKALQQQLKVGGATTSAGIKHILHDNILFRFNEMREKGLVESNDEESVEYPVQQEGDQKWSGMLKKRMAMTNFRRSSADRSIFESRPKSPVAHFANDTNIYAILLPEHSPTRPQRKLRRRTVGNVSA